MAERLGTALQKLLHRFESGSDLQSPLRGFFYFNHLSLKIIAINEFKPCLVIKQRKARLRIIKTKRQSKRQSFLYLVYELQIYSTQPD